MTDSGDRCALWWAAHEGQLTSVDLLVNADWSGHNDLGCPEAAQQALSSASRNGNVEVSVISERKCSIFQVVEYLCALPYVSANLEDSLSGLSPLGSAAQGGHLQVCTVLLARGARPAGVPLTEAVLAGHWKV